MGAGFSSDDKCPFEPLTSLTSMPPLGLRQVLDIENHISSLSCYHPPLKDLVYHGSYDGTTPLLLACKYGDLKAVKRIVEGWGVDVEAAAVYYMRTSPDFIIRNMDLYGNLIGESTEESEWIKVDGASPLFVAANCGNFDIIRYLLKKGANVRAKTACTAHIKYDGLSPLHGAFLNCNCSYKRTTVPMTRLLLEAGADPSALSSDQTPIWMMEFPLFSSFFRDKDSYCGVETATALINHGLDLTQRDQKYSTTILHHWAGLSNSIAGQQQSLPVVKLLLGKGADLLVRDGLGFTPIHSAVLGEPYSLPCRSPANSIALHFLLERDDVPRADKIDALELAGAEILRVPTRAPQYPEAIGYWRRAIQLRQGTKDCEPIPKSPLNLETVKTVEWNSSDQLENIIQHPSEYLIQSFLVQLRIVISCNSWEALDSFLYTQEHHQYSRAHRPNQSNIIHTLDMLWAKLEVIRCYFPLRTAKLSYWIKKTTENLVDILSMLQRDDPLHLTVEIIKTSLELISDTDHSYMADCLGTTTGHKSHNMCTLLRLIKLMALLPQMLYQTEERKNRTGSSKTPETVIKESLQDLVQRERRDEKGRSLLHIACKTLSTSESLLTVLRLLLDHGADPNACDLDGDAPLHVLAKFNGELVDAAANLLLEKGAHLDRVNKSGKTAADVWLELNKRANERSDRPSWCRQSVPTPLMCQCARVIRVHKVPYTGLVTRSTLPPSLHSFVEMH